ncbi:PhoD-like phosphatase N-terminal domain-containing protein [Aquabacterium sp. J223]|uniref:PhoD-like phosphatase N-terminal domain-containing protein n=1 Tax=Aquabacterium sp. J223 TaxID=2898431 RepID=UPI0021ADA63A|nr:PhoD-like phosphatase N-terminal domain-containing protein [Aquabacterium sp. J223]UUX94452.1 PhoD-like phosphatase N-terminal domain-containing protein [Aquabacterium sp. J223]
MSRPALALLLSLLPTLPLSGCGGGGQAPEPPGGYAFPQGVASDGVHDGELVLTTRCQRRDGREADVGLTLQVSHRNDFHELLAEVPLVALKRDDYRVRARLGGLPPGITVYYRFVVDHDVSPVGRALTGPATARRS